MSFTCRLCGTDELFEISLVPRTFGLDPETGELDVMGDNDVAYWESETNLGVGCITDTCANWKGHAGVFYEEGRGFYVVEAKSFEEVTGSGS